VVTGSTVILYTFLKDYGSIIISNGFFREYSLIMQNKDFLAIASTYIPQSYSWSYFVLGEILILTGTISMMEIRFKPLSVTRSRKLKTPSSMAGQI
jgi:hypothetical protein